MGAFMDVSQAQRIAALRIIATVQGFGYRPSAMCKVKSYAMRLQHSTARQVQFPRSNGKVSVAALISAM